MIYLLRELITLGLKYSVQTINQFSLIQSILSFTMDKLTEAVPALNKFKNVLEKDLKDESKPWTKWLSIAEEKSGVNRVYLFVGKNQLYFALRKKRHHVLKI